MAKLSTVLVIAFLLLVFTLAFAARPQPSSSLESQPMEERAEIEKVQAVEEEGSEEERLLRRKTMDAHLDYIYTQHNPDHHP